MTHRCRCYRAVACELRPARMFAQLIDERVSDPSVNAHLLSSSDPPINSGSVPEDVIQRRRSGLIPGVDLAHRHLDPKAVERSRRRLDLLLPHDLGKSGRAEDGAGLQMLRIAVRSPLVADLERLWESEAVIGSKRPATLVNSVPVGIVHCELRPAFASECGPCRDLPFIDLKNDQCGHVFEAPGQSIRDLV